MTRSILCLLAFVLTSFCSFAQPTDNPYRTMYPGAPADHWTENLRWSQVLDITTVPGPNWLAKLITAQDQLVAQGGGVIYFPAGDYYIQNNFNLKPNIILRGVPSVDNVAKSRGFSPQSRLSFPEYVPTFSGTGTPDTTAFKVITASNSFNNALVDFDVNRGRISLSQGTNTNTINGMVLSVRSNNVAVPSPDVPTATQNAWQRFSYRFGYNIVVRNYANAIIANCRVNDFTDNTTNPVTNDSFEQPGYLADSLGTPIVIPNRYTTFSYTDHYGIGLNRGSGAFYGTPQTAPELFRTGGEILDNWVLKTMRVGIMTAGLGLKVKRNTIADLDGKEVYLNPQGTAKQRNLSATYENRGIDFSGWSVQVDSNDIEVYRHRFYRSNYLSVDGEGILVQECCGGSMVNDYHIGGNSLHGDGPYIGIYKMRDIQNLVIEDNNLNNVTNIYVESNVNGCTATNTGSCYAMRNVEVRNNYNIFAGCGTNPGTGILLQAGVGSSDIFCYGNVAEPTPNAICSRTRDSILITGPCSISLNPDPNQATVNTNTRLYMANCSTPFVPGPAVFPSVSVQTPTDTTIINASAGSVAYTIQTLLNYDVNHNVEVEYWKDAQLLGALSSTSSPSLDNFLWNVSPTEQGTRIISAKITDLSATPRPVYSWSQPIKVKVLAPLSLSASSWSSLVRLYPNPVMQGQAVMLTVPLGQNKPTIQVFNLRGQLLPADYDVQNDKVTVQTNHLAPGVYTIRVSAGANSVHKKLVVQ